jgi:hypothetical protein
MSVTRINLTESMFGETEKIFLENEEFKISLFRYRSGVCSARIENSQLSLVVLPFQGQQIWRLSSRTRDLTMKSVFYEPESTTRFGLNYGGFLIHCGLTATGNPSAQDSHPLHGELPNCQYQKAHFLLGSDGNRDYVALGGCFTYRNSLEYTYAFEPEMRLFEDATVVEMEVRATNYRSKPMKYMYMAHINWLPVEHSRLVYSADRSTIEVFNDTFGLPEGDGDQFRTYVERLEKQPSLADVIDSQTQVYDPELCMYMRYLPDENGFAHALQVFPEGDAGYVAFRTAELPNAVRWFARIGDEDAVGFAIPGTNNHLGFSRNDEKGLIRQIPAKADISMRYKFGHLNASEAKKVSQTIDQICNG